MKLLCVQKDKKIMCAGVVGSSWMVLLSFNAYILKDSFCLVFPESQCSPLSSLPVVWCSALETSIYMHVHAHIYTEEEKS